MNAPFGHRAGLRDRGRVRYLGWAVPEAVYIDFDVIASAPPGLNRSGVGDVLCYHTARFDWQLADRLGRTEPRWPYDPALVADAATVMASVVDALDEIRGGTEAGVRALVLAHRWGGTTFHDSGWNPRHIEGVEHFLFYNLERITGRHFIHGQPVGLGIVAGSVIQDNEPERMVAALARAGVDIRPEAMGVTWDDVAEAMRSLPAYVRQAGLWFSVADAGPVTDDHVARVRELVDGAFAGSTDARRWPAREDRAHAAAGLRPRVPRDGGGRRVGADRRGRALGRVARLRVALGLRPHAGRSAASWRRRSSSRSRSSPPWRWRRAARGSATSCWRRRIATPG